MTLLLAISGWDPDPWAERFRQLLTDRKTVILGEPFDRREVHYAITWKHPHGALANLPNLAAIFSLGAGVDHVLNDERLPDVPLARVVDTDLTNRMSEYVVLHCLAHLRQLLHMIQDQRGHIWGENRGQPAAKDVTVGILGMGVLGQDAARKLQIMGFPVIGWSRTPKELEGLPAFSGTDGLDSFLSRADIVVCLLPLTSETQGFLNRSLFERMRKGGRLGGPVLINAARGGIQVEEDILACLDEGVLKAVTLDVFQTEPLPAHSPLWEHKDVLITPHNAAMSSPDAVAAQIVEQIRKMEAGLDLNHVVDRDTGY
jgi:glyoxylate/hydroxypyruvate reductase